MWRAGLLVILLSEGILGLPTSRYGPADHQRLARRRPGVGAGGVNGGQGMANSYGAPRPAAGGYGHPPSPAAGGYGHPPSPAAGGYGHPPSPQAGAPGHAGGGGSGPVAGGHQLPTMDVQGGRPSNDNMNNGFEVSGMNGNGQRPVSLPQFNVDNMNQGFYNRRTGSGSSVYGTRPMSLPQSSIPEINEMNSRMNSWSTAMSNRQPSLSQSNRDFAMPSFGDVRTTLPSFDEMKSTGQSFDDLKSGLPSFNDMRSTNSMPSYDQMRSRMPTYEQMRSGMPTHDQMRPRQPSFDELRSRAPGWDQMISALPTFGQMTSVMPGIGKMQSMLNSGSRLDDNNGQRPVSQLPFTGGQSLQEDTNGFSNTRPVSQLPFTGGQSLQEDTNGFSNTRPVSPLPFAGGQSLQGNTNNGFYNPRPLVNFDNVDRGDIGGSMNNPDMAYNMDQLSGNMRSMMDNGFDMLRSFGGQQQGAGLNRRFQDNTNNGFDTRSMLNNQMVREDLGGSVMNSDLPNDINRGTGNLDSGEDQMRSGLNHGAQQQQGQSNEGERE